MIICDKASSIFTQLVGFATFLCYCSFLDKLEQKKTFVCVYKQYVVFETCIHHSNKCTSIRMCMY